MTPVEKIKERLDIVEVVGTYVELQKAGKHFKGKSPFTNEKTPSFFVSPDRGMYYCFSSQKGGDMFTFIEEMEGVDFKGALKMLAEKAGVELVPEDPKKRDARETQYALLEAATQFFFRAREAKPEVTAYVTGRGVRGETIHAWRIGYAPDEWRSLRSHLREKGFTDAEMLAAGLIKEAGTGKEPYDVFRDRIMFPIADPSGRIIAFSGRTLKKDDGVPKYVNSPETELFQKSEVLFGYDKARQGIRQYNFSLIVEGQFDVVLSHQAGYTNAVAVSGTALTEHHVGLLSRLSNRVVLALDADRAGVSAVKRSAHLMLTRGMDVKVARLPEGKDPADLVREDMQQFRKAVGQSTQVIEFLLSTILESQIDTRTQKLRVREELLPILLYIPNKIDREHFEGVIATAIDTTRDAIHFELERLAEEVHYEPGDGRGAVDTLPDQGRTQRKEELIAHMHVVIDLIKTTHAELASRIEQFFKSIEERVGVTFDTPRQEVLSRTYFVTESAIAGLKERLLREDIEAELTELMHLATRERIASIKTAIRTEESAGNDTAVAVHLKDIASLQKLLAERVDLSA